MNIDITIKFRIENIENFIDDLTGRNYKVKTEDWIFNYEGTIGELIDGFTIEKIKIVE
jgi:hypothetical protein